MTTVLTAVIPTRNRPNDLVKAVISITAQTRMPDELIIVDQSLGDESRILVEPVMLDCTAIKLVYIHDTRISGLVEAKRVAAERAKGDIVCFLEDDVILDKYYFEEIEKGFIQNTEMMGCSGVITNQPHQSSLYRFMHGLFFKGIFNDPRVSIFNVSNNTKNNMILCDVLSGGLSAWRREVLSIVQFDVENGFFMLEDIEYSTRVVKKIGHCLYINTKACLVHNWSPHNRDPHGQRQRRKLKESILFYKKRKDWPGAKRGIILAITWWLLEALQQAIKCRSAGPLLGYFLGLKDGVSQKIITQQAIKIV